jgi:hypothetical protein
MTSGAKAAALMVVSEALAAEARRADAEARARAEERIRELQAALRRGQGSPPPP